MRPEILAPAGSMEALKAAVHAGADAVYLGGDKFGARAYASNFDSAALIEAIEYCHLYGVKVYLTINTLFRNEEILELSDYLTPLYLAGLDAVIVQDFGVMRYVHEVFPDLAIHASTQMTITTGYAYNLLKEYGVTRIVPARELSMDEIASLKNDAGEPEVEVFVQGALCYCYSGQCLMSSMLGGRSGNRGRCAQTCRLPYSLFDEAGRQIQSKGEYLLSPKDLCGLEAIPELIQAGVDSFKIEGRMKRPEYVAACVRAYRTLVDAWYAGRFSDALVRQYKTEMAEVFNRGGFTEGYYNQKNGKAMMSTAYPGNIGTAVGNIVSIHRNQLSIQLKTAVHKGDLLVLENAKDDVTLTSNVDGKKGDTITLNAAKTQQFHKGQVVRRISNKVLMDELQCFVDEQPKVSLIGTLQLTTGAPASFTLEVTLKERAFTCTVFGNEVESATKMPLSADTVRDKVSKIGNTRYQFDTLQIVMSDDAFYPLKALKDIRRNAIETLEQIIIEQDQRTTDTICRAKMITNNGSYCDVDGQRTVAMVSNNTQYEILQSYDCIDSIYLDLQYLELDEIKRIVTIDTDKSLAVVLPPILRKRYLEEITDLITWIRGNASDTGIVVRNIDELALLKTLEYNGPVIADYSLYVMNHWSAAFVRTVFPNARLTLPVELNEHQIQVMDFESNSFEMVVYGYQQLMVSAQCLQLTTKQCSGMNDRSMMKDRYFKNFFIFSVCKYCYNLIYNGIPTVLYDLVDRTLDNCVTKRLHFTKENESEVCAVMEAFLEGTLPEGEKTRGHYKRGVE